MGPGAMGIVYRTLPAAGSRGKRTAKAPGAGFRILEQALGETGQRPGFPLNSSYAKYPKKLQTKNEYRYIVNIQRAHSMKKSFVAIIITFLCIFCMTGCKLKKETIESNPRYAEDYSKYIDELVTEKNSVEINPDTLNNDYYTAINDRENDYEVSVGNITLTMPKDYVGHCYDGIKNEYIVIDAIDRDLITGGHYYKTFNILYFRKDSDFEMEEDWGYNAKSVPVLENYLNETSIDKPDFFVWGMRRNTSKGIDICETLTLSRFIADDVIFERNIVFLDNEYFYKIGTLLWGLDFERGTRKEMAEYFNEDFYWIREKKNEIFDRFINFQKLPQYLEDLFIETDRVFDTVTFKK
jgi:hypothetical protein